MKSSSQSLGRSSKLLKTGKLWWNATPVTLAEVVFVLQSFYGRPWKEVAAILLPLVSLPGFVMRNKDRYLHAVRLFGDCVTHFGDACACACAMEGCAGRLYSFDRKLSKVAGVERQETLAVPDADD